MRIGELSDQTGTPATTLRYYESVGLLAPPRRSSAGHRAYPPDAIERVEVRRDGVGTIDGRKMGPFGHAGFTGH